MISNKSVVLDKRSRLVPVHTFKVVLIGDMRSGKTSYIKTILTGELPMNKENNSIVIYYLYTLSEFGYVRFEIHDCPGEMVPNDKWDLALIFHAGSLDEDFKPHYKNVNATCKICIWNKFDEVHSEDRDTIQWLNRIYKNTYITLMSVKKGVNLKDPLEQFLKFYFVGHNLRNFFLNHLISHSAEF